METWIRNLRFAVRLLWKNRAFTAVAVLTLAGGISANTAIFSLVNAVLLRPLPFTDSEQLVWIWSKRTDRDKSTFSLPDFMDYNVQNRSMEKIAGFVTWSANLVNGGEPERVIGVRSSANIFQLLGVDALVGRTLLPEDDNPARPRVVMLSHGFWMRRFGGRADITGNRITLNDEDYIVAGVLRPSFAFPGMEADLVVPLVPGADPLRNERASVSFLRVIGRLKKSVTPQQAEADWNAIAGRLQKLYPVANASKKGANVIPLREEMTGNFRRAFILLSAAVGSVLLIACANLANLLLARGSTRYREIAIRLALGATRRQVFQQLFTENTLLALSGGALGLFLAPTVMQWILSLTPVTLPRTQEIQIDLAALLFTFLISLLCALLFGLLPALNISKQNFIEDLRGSFKGSADPSHGTGLRKMLILAEVTLSLLLLIGAGLLMKSFLHLHSVAPGFDYSKVLVLRFSLPKSQYSGPETVNLFCEQLSAKIERLPGVDAASVTSALPLGGANVRINFSIAGRPPHDLSEQPVTQYRMIAPNYFRAMKIPIHRGRDFTKADTQKTQPVAIINEIFAKRYWSQQSPLGSHVMIDDNNQGPRQVEIIGVVGAVRHTGLHENPAPEIYLPIAQIPHENVPLLNNHMSWVVRTSFPPMTMIESVRRAVQEVNAGIPVSNVRSMEQVLSTSIGPQRFHFLLITLFAVVALVLATMGIYAVISYSVAQRRRELGLRIALGAQRSDLLRLVIGEGLRIVIPGIGIGVAGAFLGARLLTGMVYGISVTDPITFICTSLLFVAIAALACYIPAHRASKVDPIVALRAD